MTNPGVARLCYAPAVAALLQILSLGLACYGTYALFRGEVSTWRNFDARPSTYSRATEPARFWLVALGYLLCGLALFAVTFLKRSH